MRISDWSSDVCSSDLQLVDNAIDASPADRSVQLVAAGEGGRVRIEVIDEGSGMTRDFIRHDLFKPFASTKAAEIGRASCREKSVSVRVDLGGRRIIKKKNHIIQRYTPVFTSKDELIYNS